MCCRCTASRATVAETWSSSSMACWTQAWGAHVHVHADHRHSMFHVDSQPLACQACTARPRDSPRQTVAAAWPAVGWPTAWSAPPPLPPLTPALTSGWETHAATRRACTWVTAPDAPSHATCCALHRVCICRQPARALRPGPTGCLALSRSVLPACMQMPRSRGLVIGGTGAWWDGRRRLCRAVPCSASTTMPLPFDLLIPACASILHAAA